MPFIMFKGERKLADVLARAYGAGLDVADAKRAETALVAANPHLAKLRDLKPGSLLVVPALPGLKAAAPDLHDPRHPEIAAARGALELFRKRLGARVEAERVALDASAQALKSKEVKELTRALPDSTPFVERAAAGIKGRVVEAEQRVVSLKGLPKVLGELQALEDKLA
jgi:hypothetical protein